MERLGMLRGVRMASVGAFVLIRRMLRLICGRRFALITVAMAIVVAYQLTDDLFISYGTVGADSLLGIDLPPLFMAAMTMGGSEAFALLLPLALLADSAWSFRNGYLSLLVARGVDSVRLSLSCMAAFMIATVLSFAVVALATGAVCALVCSGSFETELINMADTDFAPMLSWGAAGSAGLIALQLVSCLAIAAVTGFIALAVPRPIFAMVFWPALWAIQCFTPVGSALWSCSLPSTWAPPDLFGFIAGLPLGDARLVVPYLLDVLLVAVAMVAVSVGAAAMVHGSVARDRRWALWRKSCV